MSKILVVTFSHTGTSRLVSQLLCEMQSWSSIDLVDVKPRRGWMGTWRCVIDSVFRRKPAIRDIGVDLLYYDAVVLVSPIWVYRMAGPMRTFVSHYRDQLRDVAVISVMGSSGAPNAVAEIGQILGRAPLMTTSFTTHEVEDGSYAARLQGFGHALQEAEDSRLVVRPTIWSPKAA